MYAAPGCDGQTLTDFDRQRDHNLYRIWNRLCSGSYFPPPVRKKRIPKDNGKERILDIVPTKLHERVSVILGSKNEVERVVSYHQGG